MKAIHVEIPEQLAEEMAHLVKAGWFSGESEIMRLALVAFVRRHRLELQERFQQEDIVWALQQKEIKV